MLIYTDFSSLLADWAACDAKALLFGDPVSFISYKDLAMRIRREADTIRANGERRCLFITDHAPETVVRLFAYVLAGCDVVLVDETNSDDTLAMILKLSCADSISCSDNDLYEYLSGFISKEKANFALPEHKSGEDGYLIFFTSGTTSPSKAVVLTSQALLRCTSSGQRMLPCGQGDILLCLLSFSHVFGIVCGLFWGLCYGAAVALGRGTKYMMSDCAHFKPTILPIVPSVIHNLVQRDCLNDELLNILVGAAPLSTETMLALGNTGRKIYMGYGLTETSSGLAITQNLSEPNELYPCPDVDICIESDGEISVSTPCMMEGYLTFSPKETFIPMTSSRLFTGDLGFLTKNGALVLTGRKKDLLILPNGMKIFCPDYEKALAPLLGTDDIALLLIDQRPILMVGGMRSDRYPAIAAIVEEFNQTKPADGRIYDVVLQEEPLPRTKAGKLRRWQLKPAGVHH